MDGYSGVRGEVGNCQKKNPAEQKPKKSIVQSEPSEKKQNKTNKCSNLKNCTTLILQKKILAPKKLTLKWY